MAKSEKKKWAFATRFRRNAFGWRSQPAIARVKQAGSEIKKAARPRSTLNDLHEPTTRMRRTDNPMSDGHDATLSTHGCK